MKWTNTTITLGQLKPWSDNPKTSSKKDARALLKSWDELGQFQTIAIGPGGEVYDGHQRLSALLTAHGADYVVEARQADRALTDEERRKIALYSRQIGAWDWDKLANWQPAQLMEFGGFDSETLKTWKRDIAALGNFLQSETAGDDPAKDPGVELIGKKRGRWSFRRGIGFLCLRSFITERKKRELETLKYIKKERPAAQVGAIADEISEVIKITFGNVSDFIVTGAPRHKTGFALHLAEVIARLLGCQYQEVYTQEVDESAKRSVFGSRAEVYAQEIKKGIIWIDDTLTTGQTLEACRKHAQDVTFIPVVWIYDDAREE